MLRWGGMQAEFAVTIGYYSHGEPGEVFISGAEVGSEVDAATRDNAVLISLGLQYGVPLSVMQGAMTREQNGAPSTIAGKVVDMLAASELKDNLQSR
jgi:hypothetical protein